MTTAVVFLFTVALIIGVANTMGADMLRTFTGLTNERDTSITDSIRFSETDIGVRMLTNFPQNANSSNALALLNNVSDQS